MAYKVTLKKTDGSAWTELVVPLGRTILETALSEGIDYPHGCQAGNCGGCKSYLLEGEVEMSPYSDFALSTEERGRELILTCRSVPWSDCVVQPIAADDAAIHASRRLICRVAGIEQATHDIRILTLEIVDGGELDFTAGQYASIRFADLPARDFSMASLPTKDRLEFHIRLVRGGAVTDHVHTALTVGDQVEVRGPMGTAHYRAGHRGPILLLAGGSGLAPIKAILEATLADRQNSAADPDIFLYFGARDEPDIYLEDILSHLAATNSNLRYTVALSEPTAPTSRRTGNLTEIVAADFDRLDGFKVYMAGPPPMVESMTKLVLDRGVARRDCHADAFYTQSELATQAASQN